MNEIQTRVAKIAVDCAISFRRVTPRSARFDSNAR